MHFLKQLVVIFSFFCLFLTASFADSKFVKNSKPNWEYILTIDPQTITDEELAEYADWAEENYQLRNQVEGILWSAEYAGSDTDVQKGYGNGGDTALWTGVYLAAATYRFAVTQKVSDLEKALAALRGIYILTHVSGVPGVLARNAFPKSMTRQFNFPTGWWGRIQEKLIYDSPKNLVDPFDPTKKIPQMIFYTAASRDQLTGVLFGLSVAWTHLRIGAGDSKNGDGDSQTQARISVARNVIAQTVLDLYYRYKKTNFSLEDHMGRQGSSANQLDGLLELQFYGLYTAVLKESSDLRRYKRIHDRYKELFNSKYLFEWGSIEDLFNFGNNIDQYYAWNLRFLRSYSLFILEADKDRRFIIQNNMRRTLWPFVRTHQNAQFTFLYNATANGVGDSPEKPNDKLYSGIVSLRAITLKPMRSYSSPLCGKTPSKPIQVHLRQFRLFSIWDKEPSDPGPCGLDATVGRTGIDFLLPYWLAKHEKFIK